MSEIVTINLTLHLAVYNPANGKTLINYESFGSKNDYMELMYKYLLVPRYINSFFLNRKNKIKKAHKYRLQLPQATSCTQQMITTLFSSSKYNNKNNLIKFNKKNHN